MALNFPSPATNGQTWTDPTGRQWVYDTGNNSWTAKGGAAGGMVYKGGLDVTTAPPAGVQSGWLYTVTTGGTVNAGFTGLTGSVPVGSQVVFGGPNWQLLSSPGPWARTGTTLTPSNAGDSVFTAGDVKVGGTTAAPNITLRADGNCFLGGGTGSVATPTSVTLDGTYSSTPGWDKLKLYLYKSATESFGFGVGASADIQYWAGAAATGRHSFYTARTERVRINGTGNLLLGGALPASPNIQLNANGTGAFKALSVVTAGGTATDLTLNQTGIQTWSVGLDASDTGLSFRTLGGGAGRKAVLTQGGDFLLGGTLPASPNVTLRADGVVLTKVGVEPVQGKLALSAAHSNGYGITTLGSDSLYACTGSWSNGMFLPPAANGWSPVTSESRLKDFQSDPDVDQCWTLIRDIELKRYYYKDQDDKSGVSYMGPMADWLGVQDPELLIDTGRTDEHGKIHTYNQGLLDMKALAALSAALKRIEDLEARLAALEPAPTVQKQADPGKK